jgi:thiol-disulfide isomerase/thioredoxin
MRASLRTQKSNTMTNIHSEDHRSIIATHPFVVVKFGIPNCAPCKSVSKALESISQRFPQVAFLEVDAMIDGDLAAEMNVRTVPAIFFAVNGAYLKDSKGYHIKASDAKSMETIVQRMVE